MSKLWVGVFSGSNSNFVSPLIESLRHDMTLEDKVTIKELPTFSLKETIKRASDKTIKIPSSKGIIDSDQRILGIAYGHKSKTGGGNIIAAGRIVPNYKIITPPDNIILNFNF
mgnify:CR=1 FL=1